MKEKLYYRVASDLRNMPDDNLAYGYEDEHSYYYALRRLVNRWHGQTGEYIESRHNFILLAFRDTASRRPVQEWIPRFLLQRAPPPVVNDDGEARSDNERKLDEIFGFD